MILEYFNIYAVVVMLLWVAGMVLHYINPDSKIIALTSNTLVLLGLTALAMVITLLWVNLERPPMRTLGETRLWYSFFLSTIGYIFYLRWKQSWFLTFSLFMSSLFLILNIISPENFSNTLMPALHSPWFVPHVIVYIIAYALLGASSLIAAKQIVTNLISSKSEYKLLIKADNLVYLGFSFLTMGLLFGALWAKEAWGHYWTWDPKETWAFLTWAAYLIYIHGRIRNSINEKSALWVLVFGFIILLMCWFGVNYLPSASNSVHTYTQ